MQILFLVYGLVLGTLLCKLDPNDISMLCFGLITFASLVLTTIYTIEKS